MHRLLRPVCLVDTLANLYMLREKVPCGNPLFLGWVRGESHFWSRLQSLLERIPTPLRASRDAHLVAVLELRDKAREKGTKAAETYTKACNSLERCPVSYPRPRDLICLAGIGPKTVSILEVKWKKHCEENGLSLPGTPESEPSGVRRELIGAERTAKGKAKAAPTPDTDSESEENLAPSLLKKRKTTKLKTYIPQRGSGGYGILLSLVLAIDQPTINTQVLVTKSEVIRGAQPFSDTSYEHSEKGTYLTAWSNMKTLVCKGYVYVTGNPHKYCLTEEG